MISELVVEAYTTLLKEQIEIKARAIIDLDLMGVRNPSGNSYLVPYLNGRKKRLEEDIEVCDVKMKVIEARLIQAGKVSNGNLLLTKQNNEKEDYSSTKVI